MNAVSGDLLRYAQQVLTGTGHAPDQVASVVAGTGEDAAARALRAGSVWVNQYDGGDMTAPFGGFKQSGNGRDKSLHAFDKYTELKATWIKL